MVISIIIIGQTNRLSNVLKIFEVKYVKFFKFYIFLEAFNSFTYRFSRKTGQTNTTIGDCPYMF